MSSYTQILYQVVFTTKHRAPTLSKPGRERLFNYIVGVLEKKNCHTYSVNGVEDHIHLVFSLHPSVSLSALVKDIKMSTTAFIKEQGLFADFSGWQVGYSAFTYAFEALNNLVRYVRNQEEHHRRQSFINEYISLLKEHGIEFDVKYLP